jgi:hypothetical protein
MSAQTDGTSFLSVKRAVKGTFIYGIYKLLKDRRTLQDWQARGRPAPPPQFVKQRTVKEYARRFDTHTLVETGTYLGDMVAACRNNFRRIFSVEVDSCLCELARDRFQKFSHISIVDGDSADILPGILDNIKDPCLFWLDGHYSEGSTSKGELETPIRRELECILSHPVAGHVILIDDARCFTGDNDYPTINEVQQMLVARNLDRFFDVKDDIIRIYDKRTV